MSPLSPTSPHPEASTHTEPAPVRSFRETDEGYRWQDVAVREYKTDETLYKAITRQVLFQQDGDLDVELRYFEVDPEGYSTLERHRHVHAVMILNGSGSVLVGDRIFPVNRLDLIYIPPLTWHQFRATTGEPLGFLCLVSCGRDKPQLPSREDLQLLRKNEEVARFIQT